MVHNCKEEGYVKCVKEENLEWDVRTINWANRSWENQNKPQNEETVSNFPFSSKYYMEMFGVPGGVWSVRINGSYNNFRQ